MPAPDEIRDQASPARLVRGAKTRAVVTMEVLAEDHVVSPGRVVAEHRDVAKARPTAVWAGREDRDEPVGYVVGDLAERFGPAGPGRVLDGQLFAEKRVVPLQDAHD